MPGCRTNSRARLVDADLCDAGRHGLIIHGTLSISGIDVFHG